MKKAFTFLEILMVVVILGIFLAMATPRFRDSFRNLQLSNQAHNLAALLRYAQERAVLEERRYQFRVDAAGRRYWLQTEEGGEEVRFVRVEGRYGQVVRIPEGVSFASDLQEVFFHPDGSADPFRFSFSRPDGKEWILTNGKPFGYVRVEEKTPHS